MRSIEKNKEEELAALGIEQIQQGKKRDYFKDFAKFRLRVFGFVTYNCTVVWEICNWREQGEKKNGVVKI